jgi:hypothetical protein
MCASTIVRPDRAKRTKVHVQQAVTNAQQMGKGQMPKISEKQASGLDCASVFFFVAFRSCLD